MPIALVSLTVRKFVRAKGNVVRSLVLLAVHTIVADVGDETVAVSVNKKTGRCPRRMSACFMIYGRRCLGVDVCVGCVVFDEFTARSNVFAHEHGEYAVALRCVGDVHLF